MDALQDLETTETDFFQYYLKKELEMLSRPLKVF